MTHTYTLKTALALGLGMSVLSSAAYADGLEVTAGVAATVAYDRTSSGLSHAENVAEAYVELAANGFYGGLALASVYKDPSDDVEFTVYLGYGGEFGNGVGYDLSYGRTFLNKSGFDSHEIAAELSFPIAGDVSGAVGVALDLDSKDMDYNFGLEYGLNDHWTLAALVGKSEADDNIYAEFGVSYAFNDAAAVSFLYEDSNDGDGVLSLTLSYDFNLTGG